MIKAFLITDTSGHPFYSRAVNDFEELPGNLISGLISSIGNLGKQLFNKDLATIHFGEGLVKSHLLIITRNLFFEKKMIYFAFFIEGETCNHKILQDIAANIFIQTKQTLKTETSDLNIIKEKVDRILETQYSNLEICYDSG